MSGTVKEVLPKIAGPDKYLGERSAQKLNNWEHQLKIFTSIYGLTGEKAVNVGEMYLGDHALQFWRNYKNTAAGAAAKADIDQFTSVIVKNFYPVDATKELRSQLASCVQYILCRLYSQI